MLVTEPSAVADANPVSPPAEPNLVWRNLIAPAEPFLQSVAQRLKEQVNAFEPDIATYAEYALTNQGKQLRPCLLYTSDAADE